MKRIFIQIFAASVCSAMASTFVGVLVYLKMRIDLDTWVTFSGNITAVADHGRGITNACLPSSSSAIIDGFRHWETSGPDDKLFIDTYNQRMRELDADASKP
jgi:hypothetical protein